MKFKKIHKDDENADKKLTPVDEILEGLRAIRGCDPTVFMRSHGSDVVVFKEGGVIGYASEEIFDIDMRNPRNNGKES